jgi:hypothetical protein
MTSNDLPVPFRARSGAACLPYVSAPWYAFDHDFDTYFESACGVDHLKIDLGVGYTVNHYTVSVPSSRASTFYPDQWRIEGCLDGNDWDVEGNWVQIGQTITLADVSIWASRGYTLCFKDIGNVTSYRYYRINVLSNGGSSELVISEFQLATDID